MDCSTSTAGAIVDVVADAWGAHPSRSWLAEVSMRGKAVWSAFGLPGPWPDPRLTFPPSQAARHLAATLAARGIAGVDLRHTEGVSPVSVPLSARDAVNVWGEPGHPSFGDSGGGRVRCPLVNLHDVVEHLVCRFEERQGG
ncbi:hypothetical protein [Actinomadura keratinilytica]